jgi:hypothetical protein
LLALAGCLAAAAPCAMPARADEPVTQPPGPSEPARAAYDRGTDAYRRADYAVAAREFALADALAPHAVALKWAVSAALRADDPVLGMTLVERSQRAPVDGELATVIGEARARFAARAGVITVSCPPARACTARIDGAAATASGPTFVVPGEHLVEIVFAGGVERRWASVGGGARIDVVGASPASPPEPARSAATRALPAVTPAADETPGGISPLWFWLGVGATAALGGATVASGVDTLAKHDDYLETREPGGDDAGRRAETRTNVLLGTTIAAGVATGLLGLLAVRWSSAPPRRTGAGSPARPR